MQNCAATHVRYIRKEGIYIPFTWEGYIIYIWSNSNSILY